MKSSPDQHSDEHERECPGEDHSQKLVLEDYVVATDHVGSVLSPMTVKQIRSKTGIRKMFKEHVGQRNDIDLVILLQDWDDAYNVGGMFRVADACGIRELIGTGKTPEPIDSPQVAVTSMGAHRRVMWRKFARHDEACKKLIEEGYSLVAVEVAEGATHYMEYEYPAKCCLVLGNEGAGVYGTVMKMCEGAVFIPMAGKGRSLNVHVAGAVVAFEAMLRVKGQ